MVRLSTNAQRNLKAELDEYSTEEEEEEEEDDDDDENKMIKVLHIMVKDNDSDKNDDYDTVLDFGSIDEKTKMFQSTKVIDKQQQVKKKNVQVVDAIIQEVLLKDQENIKKSKLKNKEEKENNIQKKKKFY